MKSAIGRPASRMIRQSVPGGTSLPEWTGTTVNPTVGAFHHVVTALDQGNVMITLCFGLWRNIVIDCAAGLAKACSELGIQPWLDNQPHLWFLGFSGLIPSKPQVVAEPAR
jgi:hypothetical protein